MDRRCLAKVVLAVAPAGLLFLALLGVAHGMATGRPRNVALAVWESTAGREEAEFILVLAEQADLRGAARLADRGERASFVFRELKATAEQMSTLVS